MLEGVFRGVVPEGAVYRDPVPLAEGHLPDKQAGAKLLGGQYGGLGRPGLGRPGLGQLQVAILGAKLGGAVLLAVLQGTVGVAKLGSTRLDQHLGVADGLPVQVLVELVDLATVVGQGGLHLYGDHKGLVIGSVGVGKLLGLLRLVQVHDIEVVVSISGQYYSIRHDYKINSCIWEKIGNS